MPHDPSTPPLTRDKFLSMLNEYTDGGYKIVAALLSICNGHQYPAKDRLAAVTLCLHYLCGEPETTINVNATATQNTTINQARVLKLISTSALREITEAAERDADTRMVATVYTNPDPRDCEGYVPLDDPEPKLRALPAEPGPTERGRGSS